MAEWDFDMLDSEFESGDSIGWNLSPGEWGMMGDEKIKEEVEQIRYRKMSHVLISIPVELGGRLKEAVEKIEKIPGVEVVYGAN